MMPTKRPIHYPVYKRQNNCFKKRENFWLYGTENNDKLAVISRKFRKGRRKKNYANFAILEGLTFLFYLIIDIQNLLHFCFATTPLAPDPINYFCCTYSISKQFFFKILTRCNEDHQATGSQIRVSPIRMSTYCNQCLGSGSAYFWASRIRINLSKAWIRIRIWIRILPFSHDGV